MDNSSFTRLVVTEGTRLYRDMPWRRDTRGYYVLVSEIMLQQTQVDRVVPKFEQFIERFPDFDNLAKASLADVLTLWSGLGYNRRAKYLHEAAKKLVNEYAGILPATRDELVKLPGIGPNTAGAILAYSFNQPVLFVETNIRTVYLHHFFDGRRDVPDNMIIAKLEQTLNHETPREFYWSLMDYGSWLKRSGIKNISASKHYRKQSPLAGSVRQVRGQIIKHLAAQECTLVELQLQTDPGDGRFDDAYSQLISEGLIEQINNKVRLTN